MVLHAGEVTYDTFGVTGTAINHAFRLLDAHALKAALARSSSPLAIIVSDWFFDEVVRHSPRSQPDTYRQTRISVKETTARAWIRIPEAPPTEHDAAPVRAKTTPTRRLSAVSAQDQTAPELGRPPSAHPVFVGRQPELAQLSSLLTQDSQAETIGIIAGPGGIGKTALALHWAKLNEDQFPDGHLYLNLLGHDSTARPMSAAMAVRRLLATLGTPCDTIPTDTNSLTTCYRNAVAGKKMLIILDNVRNSVHAIPLLPQSPHCTVLITSRASLTKIASEHNTLTVELDFLDKTESAQLLAERLGHARFSAEPEPTTKIIQQCAGLPLALTIVAARAAAQPTVSLLSMSAELDQYLHTPTAVQDNELGTSLTAVLSSSYKALDEATASGFRLLGLLPVSDININAAHALIGRSAAETHALFHALTAAHLAQQHSLERYRMHDLIRLYALQRATAENAPNEITDATRRLVTYYLSAAHTRERLLYPHRNPIYLEAQQIDSLSVTDQDDVSALAWFDVELPALLATQHIAEQHGWDDLVWQLAWSLDGYLWRRGHIHHQLTMWRTGLAAAQRLNDNVIIALAHRLLGQTATRAGLIHEATHHLHRALDLTRENHDSHGEARTHYDLAVASNHQTSYALAHAHEALRLFRDLDNAVWIAEVLNIIGQLHAQSGNPAKARASCEQALAFFTQHANRHGLAAALANLGYIAHIEEKHDQALTHYHNAIALYEQVGVRYDQIDALRQLEQLHRVLGRDAQAESTRRRFLALTSTTGYRVS